MNEITSILVFSTIFTMSAAVLLLLSFNISHKRKMQQQKQLLEKEYQTRLETITKISRDLHDDVGGEVSAIRLLSGMDTTTINPKEQLSKIAVYSEDLAQKMNEIVWTLNVSNDSLQSLVAYMRRYAVKYLDDVGIECSFLQPDSIPEKEVDGTTRRHIFLLLKEALNNIVKHAQASKTGISVTTNSEIQLIIYDNGKGISPGILQNGSGNGLRNMAQRVKELKGMMEIKSQGGTTIQFNLPLPGHNTKGG